MKFENSFDINVVSVTETATLCSADRPRAQRYKVLSDTEQLVCFSLKAEMLYGTRS
jgi:hypothetical protein